MLLLSFKYNCTLLVPVLSLDVLGGTEFSVTNLISLLGFIHFNISTCSAILFSSSSVTVCIKWRLLCCVHFVGWIYEEAKLKYVKMKLKVQLSLIQEFEGLYSVFDLVFNYMIRNYVLLFVSNILEQHIVYTWRVKLKMGACFSEILVTCYQTTRCHNEGNIFPLYENLRT